MWANWEDFCFFRAANRCAPQVEEQALQLLCPAPPPLPTSYLLVGFPSCISSSAACSSLRFWTWPMLTVSRADSPRSRKWSFFDGVFLLVRVVLWLGFSNSHDKPIHMWHPSFHDILGWSARSATSRAWSSLTFEHLLFVSSAHQLGNKDHQRSWSAWQHCTNVKPSPISFRWRRELLEDKN